MAEGNGILEGHTMPCPHNMLHRIFEEALSDGRASFTGLYFHDRFMPFCEVNWRANIVARSLKRILAKHSIKSEVHIQEIETDPVIAVDLEPGPPLIIILLGILKVGAVYLPVDSQSAINRLRYALKQVEPVCIVVDGKSMFKKETDTMWSQYKVLDIEALFSPAYIATMRHSNLAPDEMLAQPHLLSIIYTSGSSGQPKGVCITHQTALNRLTWQWAEFPFGSDERGCFKTSLLFVDSIIEIFGCLLKLISIVIAPHGMVTNPERFVELLEENKVSRLTMVPSLLRSILFYLKISGGGQRLPILTFWVCNSETLPPSLLYTFFETFHEGKVFANFYGSTETMADVTFEVFDSKNVIEMKQFNNNLSIGFPMFNNKVYIVDEGMALLRSGQVGEICISGLNVADGYLDGDLHQTCFIPNPFSEEPNHSTLYKTGDFGSIQNGRLIYEGRRDLQVKIRGQRVNITEIEKTIQECPWVEKTVVLCHKFSEISSVIIAYYTTHNKKRHHQAESAMLENCRKCLPQYMCPKLLHVLEIPLQVHTGKVDILALRKMYEKAFNRQNSQELSILDEKGQKALNIIALNLNIPTHAVSQKSSFFELGGNSVSMIATIVQLREYGLHIPISVFSTVKTIQHIIDHVTVNQQSSEETLHTDKYIVRPLEEVENNEYIIDLLADSFVEKEPLVVLLGVTKEEFMPFAKSLYKEACKNNMSLIVLEQTSGRIVGGDFLFDYFDGVKVQHHEAMSPILNLLYQFEVPVKEQLCAENPGRLIFNLCLCVHKDLPHADQVMICHLLEGNVLQVARDKGFAGVITNNTNPVTQVCFQF